MRLLLMLAILTSASALHAQPTPADVAGDWGGTLTIPTGDLPIVFHITAEGDGLAATLDSPSQGAFGVPTTSTTLAGDTLTISVAAIGGGYEGVVEGDVIEGTWTQGGGSLPLRLERGKTASAPERPQEPQPPFPYRSEEVAFDNPDAEGVRLAGTLTLPDGEGPHPAALLISGSGPQDRDEALMGHKPFLVLADHLTRHGIAVLRVDDRGTAASTGDFAAATSEDFATDAWAGVEYLRGRSDIDADRIGLVGHSEGGLVAPLVAAEHPDAIGFLVLLAGPGEPGAEILKDQLRLIREAGGASPEMIEQEAARQARILDALIGVDDLDAARATVRPLIEEMLRAQGVSDDALEGTAQAQLDALATPWMRFFLIHDPAPVLERVQAPVLVLNGAKDLQVPAEANTAAIAAALQAGGNDAVAVHVLPGLNHLFQTATTGAPAEYGQIEETFAPAALDLISDWIEAQVAR